MVEETVDPKDAFPTEERIMFHLVKMIGASILLECIESIECSYNICAAFRAPAPLVAWMMWGAVLSQVYHLGKTKGCSKSNTQTVDQRTLISPNQRYVRVRQGMSQSDFRAKDNEKVM